MDKDFDVFRQSIDDKVLQSLREQETNDPSEFAKLAATLRRSILESVLDVLEEYHEWSHS
jgi:hypothetical protein